MKEVNWKVEGMTCSNCAISISKYLEKKGMHKVKVNPLDGAVSFTTESLIPPDSLKKGIGALGYQVVDEAGVPTAKESQFLKNHRQRFLFCIPFTAVLMLHMLDGWMNIGWLMNPWVQLAMCLPVFVVGMRFFGKSALQSIRNGTPNMNVLIAIGAIASFAYSLTGAVLQLGHEYLFFETTASIITIVFLGNYLEGISVAKTQKAVNQLAGKQKVMANMIAFDDKHQELVFPVENTVLQTGDLILVNSGEQVPADAKILWGDAMVNEALITGESMPLQRGKKDLLIGGSIIESGSIKAQVTAAAKDSTLSGIVRMVQKAQLEKPPMQKMADRISAIFVPVVLGIAVICFIGNYIALNDLGQALLRSVAVLVIACPCAMGLATPAAIAVGLGRAAKKGILYRNAGALETFKDIRRVVFDKTGTLTTGKFAIGNYQCTIDENEFKQLAYSLEKYSNHPIGKAIAHTWKTAPLSWKKIEELKGIGMRGEDKVGNIYQAGSFKLLQERSKDEKIHDVYLLKNNNLLGWINISDEIKPEAKEVINWLHKKNIETILLSGDSQSKCDQVARDLSIGTVYAEQTPVEKLQIIENLVADKPTAMVGDGINDAPALAKATLGISLSHGTDLAIQSADVILMGSLKNLPEALGMGKHTYLTIKQNLFWAFAYNIVAIPIAAFGLLTPTLAAFAMGFSDVVLVANSLRLFVKKVN